MTDAQKEAFLAKAAQIYDEAMEWNEKHLDGTLEDVEAFLKGKRRSLMSDLLSDMLEERVRKVSEMAPLCPSCSRPMKNEGMRQRKVETLEGDLKLYRPYYTCRACHEGLSPVDNYLGLGSSSWSEGIHKGITSLAATLPFKRAAELFQELTGVWISPVTTHRLAHKEGKAFKLHQEKEAEDVWPQGSQEFPRGEKRGRIQPSASP